MDEEKTIDEAVEEQADEMKEFEPVAFDEVIKETEPERKDAPMLRALGDPEPADMNMIHKHLDNFLAMLCGETPIDDNVRTSTEYWLKRLADGLGGSVKPIYAHMISIASISGYNKYHISIFEITQNSTAFTKTTYKDSIAEATRIIPCSGFLFAGGTTPFYVSYSYLSGSEHFLVCYNTTTGESATSTYRLETLIDSSESFSDMVQRIN